MGKSMYVNVVNEEESRIALVRDGQLDELSIETTGGFWHANGERLPW